MGYLYYLFHSALSLCLSLSLSVPLCLSLSLSLCAVQVKDLSAGLTVFILLIPQGLAYALLAGLPAIYGLYAAGVPLLIYTVFGTSRELAIGPMAIASLLSGATIGSINGEDGLLEEESSEWVEASLTLALLTGAILLGLGFLGVGAHITRCLSGATLSGFTTGVACVILLSQLPKMLGLTLERKQYSHQTIINICSNLGNVNVITLMIGVGTATILIFIKQWRIKYKSPRSENSLLSIKARFKMFLMRASKFSLLFAGLMTTLLSWGLHNYSSHSVPIVSSVPSGLPSPSMPSLSLDLLLQLLPGAVMIAVITFAGASFVFSSFAENLNISLTGNYAVARKFADKNNYTIAATSEMIAYGVCNFVGSFFSSYVVAGGFARSAVNAEGGAQSPLAGFVSGVCILLSLQFFTSIFYYLPLATLGAIIVVSVVSMMDFQRIRLAYQNGFYQDFTIMLGTAFCTFFGGVTIGLLCGIALSVMGLIISTSSSQFEIVMAPISEREGALESNETQDLSPVMGSFCILGMSSLLHFGNLDNFKLHVLQASDAVVQSFQRNYRHPFIDAEASNNVVFGAVVLDASSWGHYIEMTSATVLDELRVSLMTPKKLLPKDDSTTYDQENDTVVVIKLGLVNCHSTALSLLSSLGIVDEIGIQMIFKSTVECIQTCPNLLSLMSHEANKRTFIESSTCHDEISISVTDDESHVIVEENGDKGFVSSPSDHSLQQFQIITSEMGDQKRRI